MLRIDEFVSLSHSRAEPPGNLLAIGLETLLKMRAGVSYSGLGIARIGAFAGPVGSVPGLFITEVGEILSTLGQVSQECCVWSVESGLRAGVNTPDARAWLSGDTCFPGTREFRGHNT